MSDFNLDKTAKTTYIIDTKNKNFLFFPANGANHEY